MIVSTVYTAIAMYRGLGLVRLWKFSLGLWIPTVYIILVLTCAGAIAAITSISALVCFRALCGNG